jgi:hypothetical protein
VGTAAAWQTDALWANKTVTGLTTGITYTFQVKARYSSSYTQETALGVGATGTPSGGPTGPTITQHPSAQNVCPGGSASFSIAATGSGTLTYLWQKNSANLANGGHYSGVTTTTLAITGVDSNDAANYRCVASNSGGSATSNQAALTLKPSVAADFDHDCDVDQADFSLFVACISGPNESLNSGCENRSFDGDGDVDQSDFGIFQRCYSGENVDGDPSCVN